MKNLIIHVGVHKTGSSFLQQKIFPFLADTYITGHPAIRQNKDPLRTLQEKLIFSSPFMINYNNDKKNILDFIENLEHQYLIFSHESLFGNPFENYRDHIFITNSLKQMLPAAKIFIVFRKQDDWIESLYKLTLFWGQCVKTNDFLNYKNHKFYNTLLWSSFGLNFDVKSIDWRPYIENYFNLFGKENVLALPYELLVSNHKEFLDKFYQFSGIETYYPPQIEYINKGYSLISAYSALFINSLPMNKRQKKYLRDFIQENVDKRMYIPHKFIDEKKRNKIMRYYKDANIELEKFLNIDLKQYGYY